MAESKPAWTDQETEAVIGKLLIVGVLLAAATVAVGGVLYLMRYGGEHPNYQMFKGEPADLSSVTGIFSAVLAGSRRGIIELGLLLLIATPIARVVFSVYAFARERDRLYVIITLIVLAVLIYSLVWGHV